MRTLGAKDKKKRKDKSSLGDIRRDYVIYPKNEPLRSYADFGTKKELIEKYGGKENIKSIFLN